MFVLRRLPAFFALLMLAALSLRLGLSLLVTGPLTLALLVLLFIPKRFMQTLLGAVLWGGVLAWLGMAWLRANERLAGGQPWRRLVLIFGAVTLFTAWAAWLLRAKGSTPADEQP
ncbi:hypothetical protein GETHLI_33780 [Geothrix limicola]|uniref:Uncharacterized protein n=1 Tax=Geothrix limicola TaxID=2927978 RepID=A0ABQ5QKS0_9BACT|nr:hypothetical protein [Geothrix limicola]GLH74876.1 hypothetical protein GETHLI_33780 [Geothrix limicola]